MSARTDIHPWYIHFNSLSQAFWMATRFLLISTSPAESPRALHPGCICLFPVHLKERKSP